MRRVDQVTRLLDARGEILEALQAVIADTDVAAARTATLERAKLLTEMEEAAFEAAVPLQVKLIGTEKTMFENACKTYREETARLKTQRGKAYALLRGQCTTLLVEKMKHDADYTTVTESDDPLLLMSLIEKTILAKTDDQYPHAIVYEQLKSIFDYHQNNLSHNEYYDRMNTKVDVADSIGTEFHHRVLHEFHAHAKDVNVKYKDMDPDDQAKIRVEAAEAFLSYVMIRQSGRQHQKLRTDLMNSSTTGSNMYPPDRQATLHLLDQYSKAPVPIQNVSQGASFAQVPGGNQRPYDTEWWADKTCHNCLKKGHPASHCRSKPSGQGKPPGKPKPKGKSSKDDDKSVSSKSSKSSLINKVQKQMKQNFMTMNDTIIEIGDQLPDDKTDIEDEDDDNKFSFHQILYNPSDDEDDEPVPPLQAHHLIEFYESDSDAEEEDDDVPDLVKSVFVDYNTSDEEDDDHEPPPLQARLYCDSSDEEDDDEEPMPSLLSRLDVDYNESSDEEDEEPIPSLRHRGYPSSDEEDEESIPPLMPKWKIAMYESDSDEDEDPEVDPYVDVERGAGDEKPSAKCKTEPEDDLDVGHPKNVPDPIAGVGVHANFNQFAGSTTDVLFKQGKYKEFVKSGIKLDQVFLLDNQSTMCLVGNPEFVTDIRKCKKMVLRSNGGTMTVQHQATLEGYGTVWFSAHAITNILSLKNMTKIYRVSYDSDVASSFIVHRESTGKENMEFRMHPSGLHYHDPLETEESVIFLQTAEGNKKGFTKRQVKDAESARTLYAKLAYPSIAGFRWAVQSHAIKDCPITVQMVDDATTIWGKSIAALKGKTTRRATTPVSSDVIKVPKELFKLHHDVTLSADIFYVNGIPFFITHSRKIEFTTAEHMADTTIPSIMTAWKTVQTFYEQSGFKIVLLLADGEFAAVQALIQQLPGGPKVNITSASEHVPEIERKIRGVKERTRAMRHGLPFSALPVLLTINIVLYCVRMLNYFPAKGGISDIYSPMTIMTGQTLSFKEHLRLQIGSYVQVHEEDTPRNSQLPRTKGAICLGPSGNQQGGYKFLSLKSGYRITRRSWDEIPMPDTVIDRVNVLGHGQNEQLIFTDRKGRRIGDVEIPGVDGVYEAPHELDFENPEGANLEAPPLQEAEEPDPIVAVPLEPAAMPAGAPEAPEPQDIPPPMGVDFPGAEGPEEIPGVRKSSRVRVATKAQYEPTMKGKSYAFAQTLMQEQAVLHPDAHEFFNGEVSQEETNVVQAILTQLSLKVGMKQWGAKAENAVHAEMKQLHMRDTFRPMHWRDLTPPQKATVLESHMFLKLKRDGKIKGRTVAGGNKQRDYISKEDSSSPTVCTEAVILSCIIDAEEGRDVVTIDIPNAFIQTRIDDEEDMAIIKIRGVLVDILVDIAPSVYKPYVTKDKKGGNQLVVQAQNAIYGTMVAGLLYYRKFKKTVLREGFEINDYDPCVANRKVNGTQQTILWHVDDCKLSHVDPEVNTEFVEVLKKEYESIFEDGSGEMTVHRGKVHKYLGMTLDYSIPGQCKLSMFGYIDEILEAFDKAAPGERGTKTSAAPSDLFQVDDKCTKLNEERNKEFHHLVAKTLWATKRARPDTGTAIGFLTTRVREPDTQDWTKLSHLMKYLRGTRKLPLILSANGSGILKWWVDGSFGVHPNRPKRTYRPGGQNFDQLHNSGYTSPYS